MDIVISILLLLAITSTSITFAVLFKLQEQNRKQEDLLKAVACILLIVPEDRNETNFASCINKNRTSEKSGFEFKTNDQPVAPTNKVNFYTPEPTLAKISRSIDKPVKKIKSYEPKPQERYNKESGVWQMKYENDTDWQLCEVCENP